jgi:hypothetical protein
VRVADEARPGGPAVRDPLAGAASLPAPVVSGVLRATVAQAAAQSFGEAEFFARLRASGLLVRERFSELNPGEVTGYAVSLRRHAGTDGTPRWYGGGRLHDSLTLPQLRARWTGGEGTSAERSGGVPDHCPGTHRDLPARDAAGDRRGGSPAQVRRR